MKTNKTENNEIKDHISKLEEISKKFGEIDKKYKEHKKANQNTLYSFAKAVGNTIGVRNSTEPEHKKLTDLKNELDSFIITEKEFTNQLKDQSISSIQKAAATKSSIEGVNNFESSFNTTKFDKGFTDRLDEISKNQYHTLAIL